MIAAGGTYEPSVSDEVIDIMIDGSDAPEGGGAGFYDYPAGGKKSIWPGLVEKFHKPEVQLSMTDMKERMLFVEAIEAIRAWEEGVINSAADANIGSIMGIGFPAWTGGVIQYVNNYQGGLRGFVARARELAGKYGERFNPPKLLVEKAEKGELFE